MLRSARALSQNGVRSVKKLAIAVSVLALLVFALPALSHDFWLVPNAFNVAVGEELVVRGQTSSDFPTSLSAVTVDRVASARVLTASGEHTIEDLAVEGTSLHLSHRPARAGQAVVAVAIHPRNVPESPESFRNYLRLEGAPEALARYERMGILPTDSIVRRYAKYAKVLVEVGQNGDPAYNTVADHPLEFVPLSDPSKVSVGGSLRMRMLFLGDPVAGARGHVSVAESTSSETAYAEAEFETDGNGEVEIQVSGEGLWNVRALWIVPAPTGSGADWDVHWATFVWATGT